MRTNSQTQYGLACLSSCIIANFINFIVCMYYLHHNLGNFVFIVLYVRMYN